MNYPTLDEQFGPGAEQADAEADDIVAQLQEGVDARPNCGYSHRYWCELAAAAIEEINRLRSRSTSTSGVKLTECPLVGDVIHCSCGKPSSHYGTMGVKGAREVREIPSGSNPDSGTEIRMLVKPGDRCDHCRRIRELEAALRDIAVGLLPEDGAAGDQQRYVLCASRLCAIARNAIRKFDADSPNA